MSFNRKQTRQINIGGVRMGGKAPIIVQTMTKTDTRDVASTLKQIKEIAKAGGEIVRLAIPDKEAAKAFKEIAKKSPMPLVADIHFDHKLAIECVNNGAAKIRFNPGNIGSKENLKKLVDVCKKSKVPIRIGVNSGSLEKKFTHPTASNLAKSALEHVKILERENFYNICISAKSTNPEITIKANQILSEKCNYPLHIGVTEAGIGISGVAKSASAIGALLAQGIGDTIRISLTDDPVKEIEIAQEILQSLGIRRFRREFISCPGCGRTEVDIKNIAKEIYEKTKNLPPKLTIAVMGCVVNGPGEAKEADFALVGGKNHFAIYRKGKCIKTVKEKDAVKEFLKNIK